jgi:subtilisin family serine protease
MKSALYHNRSAELAWVQPNVTKHDVVVAVLDTGIDAGHPDLVGNVVGGLSFVGEDPLEDLNGHGTHVAGTISANNNGFGTSGVYPGSKVFALQVFNKLGTGSTSSIVGAINWLAQNGRSKGIRVANMSLGGPSSVAVCSAVYQAVSKGITFVVAAGGCVGSLRTDVLSRKQGMQCAVVCSSSSICCLCHDTTLTFHAHLQLSLQLTQPACLPAAS